MYYTFNAFVALFYQYKRVIFQRRIRKMGMKLYRQMSDEKERDTREMTAIMSDIDKCQQVLSGLLSRRTR